MLGQPVSKTGVLDCSKLHTYKYSEDIFKKVTTLHEGKNHGLVFLLDWSWFYGASSTGHDEATSFIGYVL